MFSDAWISSMGCTADIPIRTGPSAGTSATTCTPSKTYAQTMLTAFDEIPLNTVLTGKGNDSGAEGLVDQVRAGCAGLKLHEVGKGRITF